ncbi:unnamed protein product [Leptidea sinapis]|uniref:Zinc finger PHD-type domain-containing protein n=1 Tax=Leptidea sinapis TaxID=189913 RepID=A0A5E4QIL6_9NEOP|nr:unnamed protein product [Leptidea sinapis]
MDEKGCRLTLHHQQKVFAANRTKRVHLISQEHAENVTVAICKITNDLFDTTKEKTASDSNNGKKEINKKRGNELKKVPRETRLNKDINKKVTKASKKKESKTLEKHGGYCHGCKVDRLNDMHHWQNCQKWYHEVCVGLTKDDEEQFMSRVQLKI